MRPDEPLTVGDSAFAAVPGLQPDDVHIWRVHLDGQEAWVSRLERSLTHDEESRAGSFHFHRDRARFIMCRGALRILLGYYLSRPPQDLRFTCSREGKPSLSAEFGREGIRFNVSHSDGLALVALARSREVGVDIERVRRVDADAIAARFFSVPERVALRQLGQHLRAEAFFQCWTRKEAYLKATGAGLTAALDDFDVSLVMQGRD